MVNIFWVKIFAHIFYYEKLTWKLQTDMKFTKMQIINSIHCSSPLLQFPEFSQFLSHIEKIYNA